MNFSDKTFESLAGYERFFNSAIRSGWCPNPGRAALTVMSDAVEEKDGRMYARNFNCGSCIVRVVKRCGTLYFADKAEREAAAAPETPAPTKTPSKKTTAATAKKTTKK